MKTQMPILCCLLMVVVGHLYAQQQIIYDKGRFDVYPQMTQHQSKLEAKGNSDLRTVVWTNSCESSSGWSLQTDWQVGSPTLGPLNVPQGSGCLATNLTGLYPNNANFTATSPQIQLPAASYIELQLKEWFELESDYDFGYVEVLSGAVSNRIDTRSGTSGGTWRNTFLNLTRYQGQQISLRFHLTSDGSVPGSGWYLDDLNIDAIAPLPIDLQISGINIANHPSVYLTAAVISPEGFITDLSTENFSVFENNVLQENLFSVVTPDNTQQISTADIVFVLDVTGSMGAEIESVRNNMLNFMTYLNTQNIDYRIGFVVFGDIVYVYNNYSFYTEFADVMEIISNINLGEHGIGSGEDFPENQLEAMAEGAVFNWRPGASRVMIMLTDANAHSSDGVTEWTSGDLLAQRLIPNNIVVFPVFDTNSSEQQAQYVPIALETNQNGTYFNIYDNFNAIIQEIGAYISSLYTVHYISSVPAADPMTRIVKLTATVGNNSSEKTAFYLPGISPAIERNPSLLALDNASVSANTTLNFDTTISDRVAPYLSEAKLYWRRIGTSTFTTISFVSTGVDTYRAVLPSVQVTGTGIEYYVYATDGQSTVTLPSSNPQDNPFSIAIANSNHAVFTSVNGAYTPLSGLQLSLSCSAASVPSLSLSYRPIGSLIYETMPMTHGTGTNYSLSITDDLGDLGAQYYIVATQANQLTTYYGNFDDPILLLAGDAVNQSNNQYHSYGIKHHVVYPNPVRAAQQKYSFTRIAFSLDEEMAVSVNIYNIKGQQIRKLASKVMSKGEQTMIWDLKDDSGKPVCTGLYFYRINNLRDAVCGKIFYTK